MKTKKYKHGKQTYSAYCKPAGKGYEVGFVCGKQVLFVGNFVHATEANQWWTMMNGEIAKFSKKYWINGKAPTAFYHKFMMNHLYKTYYSYLDRVFTRHQRSYAQGFNRFERHYQVLRRTWTAKNRTLFKRAA